MQATATRLGVTVVAYCPLNSWPSKMAPIEDRHVAHIAARLGVTPSMVLLRWAVQSGQAVLTRSRDVSRLLQVCCVVCTCVALSVHVPGTRGGVRCWARYLSEVE